MCYYLVYSGFKFNQTYQVYQDLLLAFQENNLQSLK